MSFESVKFFLSISWKLLHNGFIPVPQIPKPDVPSCADHQSKKPEPDDSNSRKQVIFHHFQNEFKHNVTYNRGCKPFQHSKSLFIHNCFPAGQPPEVLDTTSCKKMGNYATGPYANDETGEAT